MVKAVIFDLDGLLVDSAPIHRQANSEFLAGFGKILLPSSGREGMRIIDIIRDYKDIYDLPGRVEELYSKRQRIFLAMAKKKLVVFPSALELIQKLNYKKLKLALATSGDRDYVNLIFTKFAVLKKYLRIVVTGDEVQRGKPYPDIYEKAIKKLGVGKSETVVLEDSINGILSAKSAGLQVICIPNKHYPDADYSLADRVFTNLSQIIDALP